MMSALSGATRSRRARCSTDPQTCFEVFRSHWQQISSIIIQCHNNGEVTITHSEPVFHYMSQMITLLIEEKVLSPQDAVQPVFSSPSSILTYSLEQDIFTKLLHWSLLPSNGMIQELKIQQLNIYEQLTSQMRQPILHYRQFLHPLLSLLQSCALKSSPPLEQRYVFVLYQMCVWLNRDARVLRLCEDISAELSIGEPVGLQNSDCQQNFKPCLVVFNLLIPLIHREHSGVGKMARDAVLLLLGLSLKDSRVAHIIRDSDFCPVLATGLSALYSSLPPCLPSMTEDMYQLPTNSDEYIPELGPFLTSLDFCNMAIKVSHSIIRKDLLHYVYTGFLVPVVGSALHQSSMEEVIAATAYLNLFLQRVYEPALLKIFLQFIITERYDHFVILESLISRIANNSKLGVVTIALFKTILSCHCEDVMYHLIFRYLVSCDHLIDNQWRCIQETTPYVKTSNKFLNLIPACCTMDSPLDQRPFSPSSSSPPPNSQPPSQNQAEYYFTYTDYLSDAMRRIDERSKASQCWKFHYDGESPPMNIFDSELQDCSEEDSSLVNPFKKLVADDVEIKLSTHEADQTEIDSPLFNNSEPLFNDAELNESPALESISCLEDNDNSGADCSHSKTHNDKDTGYCSSTSSLCKSGAAMPIEIMPGVRPKRLSSMVYRLGYFGDDDDAHRESQELPVDPEVSSSAETELGESQEHQVSGGSAVSNNSEIANPESAAADEIKDEPNPFQTIINATENPQIDTFVDFLEQYPAPEYEEPGDISLVMEEMSYLCCENHEDTGHSSEEELSNEAGARILVSSSDPRSFMQPLGSLARPPGYGFGPPTIGPFLTTLLCKLETLPSNNLSVNLLLTEMFTNLACYPQPLLKSLLLNSSLMLQPNLKSLYQVLLSLRQRIDSQSFQIVDFGSLLFQSRQLLLERLILSSSNSSSSDSSTGAEKPVGLQKLPMLEHGKLQTQKETKRKLSFSILNLFGRSRSNPKSSSIYKYHTGAPKSSTYYAISMESPKTRNLVNAAIVMEEFCKELSAIAREHSIQP